MSFASSALISAESLLARLGDPLLRLVDASAPLPGERFDARAAHDAARLPGASFLDHERYADPEPGLPHMAPSPARFARLAGEDGIGSDAEVVLYDSRRLFAAPRAWWLFRLFGHARVRVLDGGLELWRRAGGPVETGPAASPPRPARFVARPRYSLLAGLGDLDAALDRGGPGMVVLDARPAGRFSGDEPEPRPGVARGRIAGSRSLPFGGLLAADGRLLDRAALRARFAAVGVEAAPGGSAVRVIASCGTGVTASGVALAMFEAGLGEAAVYDGSWTEYAAAGRHRTPLPDRAA